MPLRRKNAREIATGAPAGPGTLACPLCGEVVPVGEDGRCDLGHRVTPSRAASETTQPLDTSDDAEAAQDASPEVPLAPVAGPAAAGLALGDEEEPDTAPQPAADGDAAATGDEDEDEATAFSDELDW